MTQSLNDSVNKRNESTSLSISQSMYQSAIQPTNLSIISSNNPFI